MNEGMPTHRNPYDKGRLIIQFSVKFPEKIDPANVGKLEALLPAREPVQIPSTAEECMLMDVDPSQMPGKSRGGSSSHNGNVYDDDDDERHGHGPQGVQCQTQ